MKLHALKRKELGFSSEVVEPRSILTATHKLSVEELDLPWSDCHGGNDQSKEKHEVLTKRTMSPQKDVMLEGPVRKYEPPSTTAPAPLKGRSSRPSSRKRGRRLRLMLDLCKGKPLPFTALQMADLLDLTLQTLFERSRTPMHQEMAIIDYKAFVGFEKGLERMGLVSYQFRYQIALACFKTRYPDLDLEEDLFTDYLEDQNIRCHSSFTDQIKSSSKSLFGCFFIEAFNSRSQEDYLGWFPNSGIRAKVFVQKIGFKLGVMRLNRVESFNAFRSEGIKKGLAVAGCKEQLVAPKAPYKGRPPAVAAAPRARMAARGHEWLPTACPQG
ncbi:hypothetical protein B296_00031472, partial [Ensete ventricosum]